VRRCAQLGLPCWKLDLAGGALIEPEEPAALSPFLHAPVVRSMIQSAASTMSQSDQPSPVSPFPGWMLVGFVHVEPPRRTLIITLILSDSAGESTQFNLACASARLDPCNVRPVLQSVIRPKGFDPAPTLAILNWTWSDLLAASQRRAQWIATVAALTGAIDTKDPYSAGHSQRVGCLSAMLARALKLDDVTTETFRLAGHVHDVGKIAIPEAILTKQGRLSPAEITLMQRHPEVGYNILKDIPLLSPALPGVLHHHERFDGMGYPHGLVGENIPLVARVVALGDCYAAMTCTRSYRPAVPRETALEEIRTCSGTQFDPALVELFLSLDFSQLDALAIPAASRQAA
jgi:HD-GYP domain-containing protein (c-di-GMP phosphodiesterase class II)